MNLTDEQVAEEVALIEEEAGWPLWPILPMKNIHRYEPNHPEDQCLGVLLAVKSVLLAVKSPTRVFLTTLDQLTEDWDKTTPHLDFDSIEDMVRAGWIGD